MPRWLPESNRLEVRGKTERLRLTFGGVRDLHTTDAELHPFQIHQVHFLGYAENGASLSHPAWLDTVNVSYRSSVDVILDFSDPVIKGMSVFHCHLLNHEDKGMMAKILFK